MKKLVFLICIISFQAFSSFAQNTEAKDAAKAAISAKVPTASTDKDSVKYWKFTGMAGLNASQTQFWNWAAGGNNNLTGILHANLTLSFKKKKLAWDSNLDTEIGELYSSDLNPKWRKSNDKLNILTKFGYQMAKSWYVSVLGGFKTQYAPGYDYKNNDAGDKNKISNWVSPSYTDLSIGVNFMPDEIFSVFVSPVAGRFTYCKDSVLRANYGVDPDKRGKAAIGLSLKAGINYTRIKNLKIITSVSLFTPYSTKEKVKSGAQPFGNFDVDWDFAISYQFLKAFNVSLMTSLKYYDKVLITDPKDATHLRPAVQFKEVLGVGIGYSF